MLGSLLLALISLLFGTAASAESLSPNDPFRAIVQRIPQRPEPPICPFKHTPPLEPADDQVLLSFEDWKAKQSQMKADAASSEAAEKISERAAHEAEGLGARTRGADGKEGNNVTDDFGSTTQPGSDLSDGQTPEILSPHFRVPITDRFNYAGFDCSARVHTAHRGAKSSSAILTSKKDRYMLSPCNTPNTPKFVVVELCEDIRIDTVQLANFEFFSGVFKDFSVSVAKTYNGPWADAGIYRAKNIRRVQSFHTPATLRDFYRYIRIDFHSHYGNEYYCPVSLLRVYGLTHLEEWKWELWEAESKSKQAESERAAKLVLPVSESATDASSTLNVATGNVSSSINWSDIPEVPISESRQPIIVGSVSPASEEAIVTNDDSSSEVTDPSATPNDNAPESDGSHDVESSRMQAFHSANIPIPPSTPVPQSSIASSSSIAIPSASPPSAMALSNIAPMKSPSLNSDSSETPVIRPTATPPPTVSVIPSSNPASPPNIPSTPVTTGGESIYRTIMNRLNAIEINHTLYARYIEQQNGAVRDLIKRLGEDIGRLEATTRAQRTTYQRTICQWEKEKIQMMVDYNQLRSKIDHLSEEIVMEKRLGVVQLCLLMAVLIFVGVTRGSRGEPVVVTGPVSVRDWGKSLSGDWGRFMRKSSSRSPVRSKLLAPTSPLLSKSTVKLPIVDKVKFPNPDDLGRNKIPLEQIQLNTAPFSSEYRARKKKNSQTRSRTPSLRTKGGTPAGKRAPQAANPHQQRSGTPTTIRTSHLRPQLLQRSSSQGTHSSFYPGSVGPKSAKKWARSAHIHPFKIPLTQAMSNGENTSPNSLDGSSPSNFPKSLDQDRNRPRRSFAISGMAKQEEDCGEEDERGERGSVNAVKSRQPLLFGSDDRDAESNWADTDSVVESDPEVCF